MQKRKLQVFVSSTYEDLIDHRLAAMEAILAAGHIPAAMEQFSPADETAWQTIKSWIDESDAFILIIGGRYGSIEPLSGKSYVQLEYEYAIEKKKPFFAVVVSEKHHAERVKEFGLLVDERNHQQGYTEFKRTVTERLSRFWNDKKDIQAAIFQKLPEWDKRSDLIGWIRADNAPSTAVTNELARLSQENRDLRFQVTAAREDFKGVNFEQLVKLLRNEPCSVDKTTIQQMFHFRAVIFQKDVFEAYSRGDDPVIPSAGDLFELASYPLATWGIPDDAVGGSFVATLHELKSYGLVEYDSGKYRLSEEGLRFRNTLLTAGDIDYRRKHFWTPGDHGLYR